MTLFRVTRPAFLHAKIICSHAAWPLLHARSDSWLAGALHTLLSVPISLPAYMYDVFRCPALVLNSSVNLSWGQTLV